MNIIEQIFKDDTFDNLYNIKRWNGLRIHQSESVAEHSYMVAFLSRILAEEGIEAKTRLSVDLLSEQKVKNSVTTYALFHDLDEIWTGDILHTVKYNKNNGYLIKKHIEDFARCSILDAFTQGRNIDFLVQDLLVNDDKTANKLEKSIVKIADILSMIFYLNRELKFGNSNVVEQFSYCKKLLCELISDFLLQTTLLSAQNNVIIKATFFDSIKQQFS